MPNRDDVIRMAREAGVPCFDQYDRQLECEAIERFAQLVAAQAAAEEREACARACEDQTAFDMDDPGQTCADAIRARGNA